MTPLIAWFYSPLALALLSVLALALLALAVLLALRAHHLRPGETSPYGRWLLRMRALRHGLSGACLAALAAGLALESAALIVPAIIIGLEELYETSMVVAVLQRAVARAKG